VSIGLTGQVDLAAEMACAAKGCSGFLSIAAGVDSAGKSGICSPLRSSGPEREFGYFIFGDSGPRKWSDGRELYINAVVKDLNDVHVDDEHMPKLKVGVRN